MAQVLFRFLGKWGLHDAMWEVKTWVNAWATSTRFHESVVLRRLLGCIEGEDRQAHYAQCPMLFYLQIQIRFDEVPACPLTRLGLASPTRNNLLCVSCSFAGYHAVKRSPRASSLSNLPLDSMQRFVVHWICIEAFRAEAVQVNLPVRSQLRELMWLTDFVTSIGCAYIYIYIYIYQKLMIVARWKDWQSRKTILDVFVREHLNKYEIWSAWLDASSN